MPISAIAKRAALGASIAGVLSLSGLLAAKPAQAAIINGSFEFNFDGWENFGATTINGGLGGGPTDGFEQALLSTLSGSVRANRLESILGLPAGSLTNQGATEGSATLQEFSANAGDTLTFDWNFLTGEAPGGAFNDFAFVSLSLLGLNSPSLVTLNTLANVSGSPFKLSPPPFSFETGFQTFSYTFAASGNYQLALGVMDALDARGNSGLLVDNVRLTAAPIPVPTPALLPGLVGMGLAALRKRKGEATEAAETAEA